MKDKGPAFIDTNILVYSIYGTPQQKGPIASLLKEQLVSPFISTQVLKEFVNVSFRKNFHQTTMELKRHLKKTAGSFRVVETDVAIILDAIDIKEQFRYSFYDSLIIATAIKYKCSTLYSEDMQHGQVIRKTLRIINPFK